MTGHAAVGMHATCPAAPPAQKKPTAQTVGVALVEPAAHPHPGAAASHAVHAALDAALVAADHVPAAQGVGDGAPAGQKEPAGHTLQVALVSAPSAAEKVPPGHAVAFTEAHGQKEPAGQATGAPEAQK